MVGLDSNPQPQQNPQQQDQTIFFNKGEEVEVSSEEEGFRGAWYVATILEFPKPQPQATVKSASKKKRKAIVQYKTLVTEDGSIPLVEQVDPHLIRPLPPQDLLENDGFFQENEAIDASLRDGWWSGVVKKVLDGESRYLVYFDNPPDVLEFDAKALRLHLDWVDGTWVRPKRQRLFFSPGTEVEVNLEKDNVRDVWLPAVVIKENEDKTFLVKYLSSRNSDEAGTMKTIVDFLHIRPCPPCYQDRNYELLERVDTRYGFGWRSGVITKLLAGRRYNVFFKQGNEDKELSHSSIRPHLDWVDGKWIRKSKGQRRKMIASGWTLLMTSLILEIASAVFDQLGYAFVGMVLAFVALLLATAELIYMARKERMSLLPICHRPSTTTFAPGKPVGTIVEYSGLVGAVWQCFYSTVEYAYARQKKDNPIKMCLPPFIFLLCVVISKLMKKSYID